MGNALLNAAILGGAAATPILLDSFITPTLSLRRSEIDKAVNGPTQGSTQWARFGSPLVTLTMLPGLANMPLFNPTSTGVAAGAKHLAKALSSLGAMRAGPLATISLSATTLPYLLQKYIVEGGRA